MLGFLGGMLNGTARPGSLSEGAGSPQGLTEGVSSDGCSGPMVYKPAHIGSEIFEWLRSSKDTPSVSLSLDSSLREGAGKRSHSSGYSLKSGVSGDFHRPYEGSDIFTFHHSSDDTPSVTPVGRDSSLREGAGEGSIQAPPWMYLWSQSASKRRLPSSMGQPLHRSSASSRRVSAGSRHSV